MLCARQPARANRKLSTTSTSGPDDPLLPATACVRTSVPQTATLQKKLQSGTLPTAIPQSKNRRMMPSLRPGSCWVCAARGGTGGVGTRLYARSPEDGGFIAPCVGVSGWQRYECVGDMVQQAVLRSSDCWFAACATMEHPSRSQDVERVTR